MSLTPCLTNKDATSAPLWGSGGGGGGGGNPYPIVSSIGLDAAFASSGEGVMNVSTLVGYSQSINITQPFTITEGHAYTFGWKAQWKVDSGTPNSYFACLEGNLGGAPNGSGNFYSPCLGQVNNVLDYPTIEMTASFINSIPGSTSAQFALRTVDWGTGVVSPGSYSSIVTALTASDTIPVLIDHGPAA